MEVRFVVVWSNETNEWYVDNVMGEALFDGADIWLPDTSEWVGLGHSDEAQLLFSNAMSDLTIRLDN
jgi:hypothetical protein